MHFAGAVTDTRRAGNYFRIVDGSRLLWGAGITTRRDPPARLAKSMARDMARTFPALKGVRMPWNDVIENAGLFAAVVTSPRGKHKRRRMPSCLRAEAGRGTRP